MTVNPTDLAWMPEAALSSKEEIPQTVPILRKKLVHLPLNNSHRTEVSIYRNYIHSVF